MIRQFLNSFLPVQLHLIRPCRYISATGDQGTFADNATSKEQKITSTLRASIPGITYVSVQDISGGCGAMYQINIEANEFVGLSRLKQHQMVTNALKDEIPNMHGLRIDTTPPVADDDSKN